MVVILFPQIVENLSRTYAKLHCKGEPCSLTRFSHTGRHTDPISFESNKVFLSVAYDLQNHTTD